MVIVRISETYDLSTQVNRMGIVGIHTPTGPLLSKLWGGLVLQHKKFRFVKCDVAMACASILPADPLQVGVEAGSIAPQDMFNPILYKAVSNDSMNQILSFLNVAYNGGVPSAALKKNSIVDVNDTIFGDQGDPSGQFDQFEMYYSLLADSDSWRKAMPQSGLEMRNLYPLVYSVVSNFGANAPMSNDNTRAPPSTGAGPPAAWPENPSSLNGLARDGTTPLSTTPTQFRGPSMRMPAIDTTVFNSNMADTLSLLVTKYGASGPESIDNVTWGDNTGIVPPCYVGLIVLPPAKLNKLYYRMKVTWTIELTGLRSLVDIATWGTMASIGATSYGTDYADQSQNMSSKTSMVDTDNAFIEKIMEGA